MGGYRLEWTNNAEIVTEIIKTPEVWPWVSDDTCDRDSFVFPEIDGVKIRVSLCYSGNVVGCFCFFEQDAKTTEIHTTLLPIAKGLAKEFGDLVLEKVFSETDYEKVTTFIPYDNPLAKRLAIKCGFKYVEEKEPISRRGKLIPQSVWEFNKCQLH